MRYERLLLIAFILLVGCGTRAPADVTPSLPPTPGASADQSVSTLHDQVRQARRTIEDQYDANPGLAQGCFEPPALVLMPTDMGGYAATLEDNDLQELGASLVLRLVSREDASRQVAIWQIMGCSGDILGAPPGATEVVEPHPVVVPGLDGQTALPELQSWHDPDGSGRVVLVWYSDAYASPNTQYHVRGQNVSAEDVVRIAAPMRPVE